MRSTNRALTDWAKTRLPDIREADIPPEGQRPIWHGLAVILCWTIVFMTLAFAGVGAATIGRCITITCN